MSGALVLAATPIGDSRDASPRLLEELAGADVVAVEDTRRLKALCDRLGIPAPRSVLTYHEHNEARRTPELVERIAGGARVVLVTDAGMPSVSDPGYRLVNALIEQDLPVTAVPGPSAVLTALALSGMPVDRFCFEGFLPRKAGERSRAVSQLATEPRTLVFFEAPHRLSVMLEALAEGFGPDRSAAVCREMTKRFEEVRRGPLSELAQWAAEGVRGEITVVVAGLSPTEQRAALDLDEVVAGIRERVQEGERLKDVCRRESARTGVSSKALYDAVLRARAATDTR